MAGELVTASVEYLFKRDERQGFVNVPADWIELDRNGIDSRYFDKHRGHFLAANVRDEGFHRRGEPYQRAWKFNHRQVSIIDTASLDYIADGLEIEPEVVEDQFGESRRSFVARHMGINVVFSTLSDGRTLNDIRPPYHIGETDDDQLFESSLLVISYNEPCVHPGRAIGEAYPGENDGMGRRFKEVAEAHRGYVGVVSLPGNFSVDHEVMVVPLPVVPTENA